MMMHGGLAKKSIKSWLLTTFYSIQCKLNLDNAKVYLVNMTS